MFRILSLAAVAALLASPALAQEEGRALAPNPVPAPAEATPALTITGGVALNSQYRFRGISLSDEKASLQGTINLNHESGFYTGVYGYSLDGFGELGGSNLELDLYGGYKKEVAKGITLDVGLLYYAYPGSTGGDFEFFEPYANVSGSVGPATLKVGAAFAPKQDGIGGNSNIYLFSDAGLPITGTPFALTGHVGYSKGRTTLTPGGSYIDWSLGATAAYRNLTLGVAYVDTDISRGQAISGGATKDIVDGAIVFSLGATF